MNALHAWIRAGAPLIYVETVEEERVIRTLSPDALPTFVWSATRGFTRLESQAGPVGPEARDPLAALEQAAGWSRGVIVLLDFHPFLRDFAVVRRLRELAAHCRRRPGKCVVLVGAPPASEALPPELARTAVTIAWPLPDAHELERTARDFALSAAADHGGSPPDGPELARLALALRGLTALEAENALGHCFVETGCLDPVRVSAEKEILVRRSGLLDFERPRDRVDVGGLDNLKLWLRVRKAPFFDPGDSGLPPPKGVLLVGVQGCGKSLMARYISAEWGVPALRFDVGRVFSSTVGSSEANVRRAIETVEAVSPCVLLVDEVEKGLSGTQSSAFSDAGTTARVFATFLTWLQDRTKPVFVVATANGIAMIPPELMRKGRFDEIFFVDLPLAPERIAILAIHLKRYGLDPKPLLLDRLAEQLDGYSGAEIEQVVLSALYQARYEGRPLRNGDLATASRDVVPLSRTMSEHVWGLREWARLRARPASLLAESAADTGP